jgi:hypothetical protein
MSLRNSATVPRQSPATANRPPTMRVRLSGDAVDITEAERSTTVVLLDTAPGPTCSGREHAGAASW